MNGMPLEPQPDGYPTMTNNDGTVEVGSGFGGCVSINTGKTFCDTATTLDTEGANFEIGLNNVAGLMFL